MNLSKVLKAPRKWRFISLCLLCVFYFLHNSKSYAVEGVDLNFRNINVSLDENQLPSEISGTLTIKNWYGSKGFCIYLPFNDPNFGSKKLFARRFSSRSKYSKPKYLNGAMSINRYYPQVGKINYLTDYLAYVNTAPNQTYIEELNLEFTGTNPRLDGSDPNTWFYDQFYPMPLKDCPMDFSKSDYFKFFPENQIKADISVPDSWTFAGPKSDLVKDKALSFEFTGNHLAFAITKQHKLSVINVQGLDIRVFYINESFEQLFPTIKNAFETHSKIFGKYPLPYLTIIETNEIQRVDVQGMVYINTPHQNVLKHLQTNWLNWKHWILTSLIASQWAGALVQVESPDDWWLLAGFIEFATLEALKNFKIDNSPYNLFKADKKGDRDYSLTYEQFQQILVTVLARLNKTTVLTDNRFITSKPIDEQNNLLYLRHAIAIKQIKYISGELSFEKFFHGFFQEHAFSHIKPVDFIRYFYKLPSPFPAQNRDLLVDTVYNWWTRLDWPNVALESVKTKKIDDNNLESSITFHHESDFKVPFSVLLEDTDGEAKVLDFEENWKSASTIHLKTSHEKEIKKIIIDPDYSFFDEDRFNNNNLTPNISFFPGNLSTISDSDYSVFWLPYFFRQPGEPFSLSTEGALFKYVNNLLQFKLDYAPSEKKTGYKLKTLVRNNPLYLKTTLSVDRDYENLQEYSITLERKPLTQFLSNVAIGSKVSHVQLLGEKQYNHEKYGAFLKLSLLPQNRYCELMNDTSFKSAPGSAEVSYRELSNQVEFFCSSVSIIDFGVRNFFGRITSDKPLPTSLMYDAEDLKTAKIRLDADEKQYSKKVMSYNFDLVFPLNFGLKEDTVFLTRSLKGRMFYDFGRFFGEDAKYLKAYGAGMMLPLGGQLSGIGSLSITRLSLLGVFYRQYGSEKSHAPSIIFDFSGSL